MYYQRKDPKISAVTLVRNKDHSETPKLTVYHTRASVEWETETVLISRATMILHKKMCF